MFRALKWLFVMFGGGFVAQSLRAPLAAARDGQDLAADGSLLTDLGRVTTAEPAVMLVVGALCLILATAMRRYSAKKADVKGHS
jgi:hypothetical protein